MNTFFTSDQHFFHEMITKLRNFEDVNSHNEWICEQYIKFVKPQDRVYFCGDIALSKPLDALDLIAKLPGRKILIAGNHDQCSPISKEPFKNLARWLDVFEGVHHFARRKYKKQEYLISHFPYFRDVTGKVIYGDGPNREGGRYEQFRLPNLGLKLIHGHCHSSEIIWGEQNEHFHVGVDAWDAEPVPLEAIQKWLTEY